MRIALGGDPQGLKHAVVPGVGGRLDQRGMEVVVRLPCAFRIMIATGLEQLTEPAHLLRRVVAGRLPRQGQLDHGSEAVDRLHVGGRQRCHRCAARLPQHDQPLRLESTERFADRDVAHAELAGEVADRELLPGREGAGEHRSSDLRRDQVDR